MAEIERNWVVLEPGKAVKMHWIDHVSVERQITDPYFGVPRTVMSWVFRVDRLDGEPVDLVYSVLSDKLRGELSGYMVDKRYRKYEFTIVKDAPGTVPPRIVMVTPV